MSAEFTFACAEAVWLLSSSSMSIFICVFQKSSSSLSLEKCTVSISECVKKVNTVINDVTTTRKYELDHHITVIIWSDQYQL